MPLLKPRYPKLQPGLAAARGIVGAWALNDVGNIARDLSGRGNNGTLTNSPTWANGTFGPSLKLGGGSQAVSIGTGLNATLNSSAFSICSSFNPAAVNGLRAFLFGLSGATNCRCMAMDWQTGFRLTVGEENAAYIITNGTNLAAGTDYRAVWTFGPGNVNNLYINGVNVGTATRAFSANYTGNVCIGSTAASSAFLGLVAETRVYNRALSPAEVAQDYIDAFRIYRQPQRSYHFATAAAPATSKYLVKPIFTLPGGMTALPDSLLWPVGVGAYAARAIRRNAAMTRRRMLSLVGWNRDD